MTDMMLNEDYSDLLQSFVEENVRFILVGAYAMAAHGYPRVTIDMDVWVMPAYDNAQSVMRALVRFGAPLHDLEVEDLVRDDTVFQIGVAPCRIDLVTGVSGLHFEDAFQRAIMMQIGRETIPVMSLDDLIINKRACGRAKDIADAEELESLRDALDR